MPKSISLMLSSSSTMNVFRLEVAMHYAVRVDVVQGIQNLCGDADGAVGRDSASSMIWRSSRPSHHSITM